MKGLKSSATLNDRFVKKLEKFVGEDNDDQVLDDRLAPKLKKKKKSKQQKVILKIFFESIKTRQWFQNLVIIWPDLWKKVQF